MLAENTAILKNEPFNLQPIMTFYRSALGSVTEFHPQLTQEFHPAPVIRWAFNHNLVYNPTCQT